MAEKTSLYCARCVCRQRRTINSCASDAWYIVFRSILHKKGPMLLSFASVLTNIVNAPLAVMKKNVSYMRISWT